MTTATRRTILRTAGIAGAAVPLGFVGPRVFAAGRPANVSVEHSYPRHRGDRHLADLRREVLGLDATW